MSIVFRFSANYLQVTDAAVATVQRVTVTQGTTQRQQQLLTVLSDRPVMEI